jgi:YidC/Oxa1 family membrane protein insertase
MQERMQKMQPELKRLEEQYKGRDPQELHQAKMKYMMEHGVNPMAQLGGCLLMFAQMPVFMGLYYCLQENVFFRLKSVFPWWIQNLAAPDMLFSWSDKIPYISKPESLGGTFYLGPFFNLLPVIAVALMWMQQKLFTPPPADEQQAMQQSVFKYMMIFFGFMFYKVPAGLCLYFIASSLWGLAERKLLPKKKITDEPPDVPGKGGKGGRGKGVPPPKPQPKGWFGRKLESMGDAWKKLLEAAEKK